MTPSEQAKSVGLKSLTQVQELHGFNKKDNHLISLNTLVNWHRDKPELFKTVIIGAAVRLGCLKELGDLDDD